MKEKDKFQLDFEKWFKYNGQTVKCRLNDFYKLSGSMQFGVLIDFFDSVGLYIEILFFNLDEFDYQVFNKVPVDPRCFSSMNSPML